MPTRTKSVKADIAALGIEERPAEPITLHVDPAYTGPQRCCGEQWVPLDVKRRTQWWLVMACPSCGDVHAVPLVVPNGVVLDLSTGRLLASPSYVGDWRETVLQW